MADWAAHPAGKAWHHPLPSEDLPSWFPLTRQSLGFGNAELVIEPDRGELTACMAPFGLALLGGPPAPLRGRFEVADGLVATCVAISQPPA